MKEVERNDNTNESDSQNMTNFEDPKAEIPKEPDDA
jgi:hypothetical protein